MADTGFVSPGNAVGNRGAGAIWTDPSNVILDDGANATRLINGLTPDTQGLAVTNYDFGSLIPAGASIDGIEVQVGDYHLSAGIAANWPDIRLILADDSDGSENKNTEISNPSTLAKTEQAGGATDLWSETITRADVIDVDWGFFIRCHRISSGATIRVDFMRMKVFYTEAAGGGDGRAYRHRHMGFVSG